MATIDFGTVSNLGTPDLQEDNTIVITYEAVMIENVLTENTTYWVSAGAEYATETLIWVGQAAFTAVVDGNMVGIDKSLFRQPENKDHSNNNPQFQKQVVSFVQRNLTTLC